MINFNEPVYIKKSEEYIRNAALQNKKISGDGYYTKKCSEWMENKVYDSKILLTTSCSHSLEMTALLLNIKEGDEVIMPSYTFVSTALAFVLRGAKICFVDIRPDTMNIDEKLIEQAITNKTKAIVVVHYAGVSCEMDTIIKLGEKFNLYIIEDAAQGIMSKYKNKYLGNIGHLGCYSFHETKNFTMGEGGALLINDKKFLERSEILREKGTNRSKFFRGMIDKYTWVDIGSSYLPSDLNAAYLYSQLEHAEEITNNRIKTWNMYYEGFKAIKEKELIELPHIPRDCEHNAHMFYIKVENLRKRTELIRYLKTNGIEAPFHYIPLHSSDAGKKYGEFIGQDKFTTKESERLLRLPLYYDISDNEIQYIIEKVNKFFS